MSVSASLSTGSLIFGIAAWIIPAIAMKYSAKATVKRCFISVVSSFGACIISMCLQFFEINHRIKIQDWSALMDTTDALIKVILTLVVVTLLLNIMALVTCYDKEMKI